MYPVFNPVAPYRDLLHTVYLFMADIANPDLFLCSCRTSPAFMRSIVVLFEMDWGHCICKFMIIYHIVYLFILF